MTLLDMLKQLHGQCGAGGQAPTSVIGLTGEKLRLLNYLIRADLAIQAKWVNWKFLWRQAVIATGVGPSDYAAPGDLGEWDLKTFRLDGEPIEAVRYEDIRTETLSALNSKPNRIIVLPNNRLRCDPPANDAYDISADYFAAPVAMAVSNSTQSVIPAKYHPAIVARAQIYYANFEAAIEIKIDAQESFGEMLDTLEKDQLPLGGNARIAGSSVDIVVTPE